MEKSEEKNNQSVEKKNYQLLISTAKSPGWSSHSRRRLGNWPTFKLRSGDLKPQGDKASTADHDLAIHFGHVNSWAMTPLPTR